MIITELDANEYSAVVELEGYDSGPLIDDASESLAVRNGV